MEDKLTGKDFLAVIGILAIAGFIYGIYRMNKEKQMQMNNLGANVFMGEIIPMSPSESNIYSPVSNTLNPFMTVYDTSEARTIGTVDMVIDNQA